MTPSAAQFRSLASQLAQFPSVVQTAKQALDTSWNGRLAIRIKNPNNQEKAITDLFQAVKNVNNLQKDSQQFKIDKKSASTTAMANMAHKILKEYKISKAERQGKATPSHVKPLDLKILEKFRQVLSQDLDPEGNDFHFNQWEQSYISDAERGIKTDITPFEAPDQQKTKKKKGFFGKKTKSEENIFSLQAGELSSTQSLPDFLQSLEDEDKDLDEFSMPDPIYEMPDRIYQGVNDTAALSANQRMANRPLLAIPVTESASSKEGEYENLRDLVMPESIYEDPDEVGMPSRPPPAPPATKPNPTITTSKAASSPPATKPKPTNTTSKAASSPPATKPKPTNTPSKAASSPLATNPKPTNTPSRAAPSPPATNPKPTNTPSRAAPSPPATNPKPINTPSRAAPSPPATNPKPINTPSRAAPSPPTTNPKPTNTPSRAAPSPPTTNPKPTNTPSRAAPSPPTTNPKPTNTPSRAAPSPPTKGPQSKITPKRPPPSRPRTTVAKP